MKMTMLVSSPETLASYAPVPRMYYADLLFPAFYFDPISGALTLEHKGSIFVWVALLMALAWGALAMVFIVPSWAGVMVTNVTKIVAALYISDAVCRTSSELERAVGLLLDAEPCVSGVSRSEGPARTQPASLRLAGSAPQAKVCGL